MRRRVALLWCALAMSAAAWALHGAIPHALATARPLSANAQADIGGVTATAELGLDEDSARVQVDPVDNDGDGQGEELDEAQHVRVVIVFPDERPAAGADVRFWPVRTERQRDLDLEFWNESDDLECALRATGATVLADDRGIVAVAIDRWSELCARSGEYYGQLDSASDLAPASLARRIELRRDVRLRVRVVDERGRPGEGLTVHAEARADSRRSGTEEEEVCMEDTDPYGFAEVVHAQLRLPMPGPDTIDWSLHLWCGDADAPIAEREVRYAELFTGNPIRLLLPLGGTIIVETTDADGTPCSAEVILDDPLTDSFRRPEWVDHGYVFPHVPLGSAWSLRVCKADGEWTSALPGPRHEAEVVRTRVRIPLRCWRIQGRVLRADGVDLGYPELRLHASALPENSETRIDRDSGAFEWSVWLPATTGSIGDLCISVAHWSFAQDCLFPIERWLSPGTSDLGNLIIPASAIPAPLPDRYDGMRCGGCRGPGPAELWLPILPPAIPRDLLRAELIELDEDDAKTREAYFDDAGRFHFGWLRPGHHRLRILADERVLLHSEIIDVQPGPNLWPPDGSQLDLRGSARAVFVGARALDGDRNIDVSTIAVPAGLTELAKDLDDYPGVENWFVPGEQAMDLLVTSPGYVPVRLLNPVVDSPVLLSPCTTLDIRRAVDAPFALSGSVIHDAVTDPALRAFDDNPHGSFEAKSDGRRIELAFAPGSVIEIRALDGIVLGSPLRIVIGVTSRQDLLLR